jgi:hypothetical protein
MALPRKAVGNGASLKDSFYFLDLGGQKFEIAVGHRTVMATSNSNYACG